MKMPGRAGAHGRLIVVSNRVALPDQTATGGLASAMRVALQAATIMLVLLLLVIGGRGLGS